MEIRVCPRQVKVLTSAFDPTPAAAGGLGLAAADEIALADLEAVVAQNVVGRGAVEIEVREREVQKILAGP